MISPELIRRYPFFSGLNFNQITTLATVADEMTVETGYYFFHEGDNLTKLFLVMDGKVDVLTETDTGPVVAITLEQNQLFGEMALLNNVPRNSTLKASGNLKVMKISGEMFLTLLCENSELALDVMRQLSDKLAKSHFHVKELQQQLQQQGPAN